MRPATSAATRSAHLPATGEGARTPVCFKDVHPQPPAHPASIHSTHPASTHPAFYPPSCQRRTQAGPRWRGGHPAAWSPPEGWSLGWSGPGWSARGARGAETNRRELRRLACSPAGLAVARSRLAREQGWACKTAGISDALLGELVYNRRVTQGAGWQRERRGQAAGKTKQQSRHASTQQHSSLPASRPPGGCCAPRAGGCSTAAGRPARREKIRGVQFAGCASSPHAGCTRCAAPPAQHPPGWPSTPQPCTHPRSRARCAWHCGPRGRPREGAAPGDWARRGVLRGAVAAWGTSGARLAAVGGRHPSGPIGGAVGRVRPHCDALASCSCWNRLPQPA